MTDHSVRISRYATATTPAPPYPCPTSFSLTSLPSTRYRVQQIVGTGTAEMPTALPAGTAAPSYAHLVTYGPRRQEAVAVLAGRAVAMFDESTEVRPRTPDSIYTLLTGDQMQLLTWDGGRCGREFVDECVRMFKQLVDRRATLGERDQEAVRGVLGLHLLVSGMKGVTVGGWLVEELRAESE